MVPWPGAPLGSRRRVEWRVRVRADSKESAWSVAAWFELGLLDERDWVAQWIEPLEIDRSAHVLQHTFELSSHPERARLYATAHGIYECYLIGQRVGDLELTPGFTDYSSQLLVQQYDITDLLRSGKNCWDVVLSYGWFRGRTGIRQRLDGYGANLGFLTQREAGDVTISTDAVWLSGSGPLVSADLMAGQIEDHRRHLEVFGPAGPRRCTMRPWAH